MTPFKIKKLKCHVGEMHDPDEFNVAELRSTALSHSSLSPLNSKC
jgi:hypothetical protein